MEGNQRLIVRKMTIVQEKVTLLFRKFLPVLDSTFPIFGILQRLHSPLLAQLTFPHLSTEWQSHKKSVKMNVCHQFET